MRRTAITGMIGIWMLAALLAACGGGSPQEKNGNENTNGSENENGGAAFEMTGTEILGDPAFEKGLSVSALWPEIVQNGGGFEKTNTDTIYFLAQGGKPVWQMAQWASKYDLAGTQPVKGEDGSVTFSNPGKKITRFADGTMLFDITTSTEYDKPRTGNDAWPHLLIQQDFAAQPNIGKIKNLNFSMDMKIVHCENKMSDAEFKQDLHTAQSPFYFFMRNINPKSADYQLSLWVGVPSFDYRYKRLEAKETVQWDIGTSTYIYAIPSMTIWGDISFHDFQWHSARLDLLPLIKQGVKAMQAKGQFKNTQLEDLALVGMNFGWEIPGTFDTGLMLKNLSVKVVE